MAFPVAGLVTGGLAVAKLLGASIASGIFAGAETVTVVAGVAAVTAFLLAMRRYDGEATDASPSRMKRVASRLGNPRD